MINSALRVWPLSLCTSPATPVMKAALLDSLTCLMNRRRLHHQRQHLIVVAAVAAAAAAAAVAARLLGRYAWRRWQVQRHAGPTSVLMGVPTHAW